MTASSYSMISTRPMEVLGSCIAYGMMVITCSAFCGVLNNCCIPEHALIKLSFLLTKAEDAGSLSAKYFHVLMRTAAWPPIDEEEILNDFWDLLMTRNLQHYQSDILGGTASFWVRCHWYKRWLPPGMVRRRFCNN